MMLLSALPFSAVGMLAVLGYLNNQNFLLLLTAAWFLGFAVAIVAAPSKLQWGIEGRVSRRGGGLTTLDSALLIGVLSAFSFWVFFTLHDHWFVLAHGIYWGLVSVYQFNKALMSLRL
ncbi:MAG: hypothetical protein WD208_12375 [Dehalococcoidia bacterium]